ncbi:MAG: deoxyhypusine synthase [Candidatus Aenigmarchaeota archaeon]|nr:deoxyhypusine synthase [Candidatus Aenigmarchaeota archaeon]
MTKLNDYVKNYDIRGDMTLNELTSQMMDAGFQATNIGRAIETIKAMKEEKEITVILSFTANMMATGLRSIFAKMVKEKFVDVVITTGGSIDHDIILSHDKYGLGDFNMNDVELHKKGLNRLGNTLIPTDRYVLLEEKIKPIFEDVYKKNKTTNPSDLINEIGKTLKDDNSVLKWASKNDIPIFCPGITDSSIGLQMFFYKQDHPDFVVDVTGDMKKLANIVLLSKKTGGIILGGGVSKHHAIGVNVVRGGLDYAIYVTTAEQWDGSLSGARTNEAVSWGKIQEKARPVTVHGDATIVFPLIMSRFF